MAQKTGRVKIKLDGATLRSKAGASLQIGGTRREADTDDQGRVYYREMDTPATVSCTLIHTSDTDLIALRDFKDGTINFECDTGTVYTIGGAFMTELGELSNGEVDFNGAGQAAEQA